MTNQWYAQLSKSQRDMVVQLWKFMETQYKDKWTNIGDRYSFVVNLKKNGDLHLSNTGNVGSNLNGVNVNLYDVIHIQNKGMYIYVKKNIL